MNIFSNACDGTQDLFSGACLIIFGIVTEYIFRNKRKLLKYIILFWLCCIAIVGEKTVSGLGRFVLIVWLFVVLIVTSSYTASLTSILTVQQLSFGIKGLDSLIASRDPIGYYKNFSLLLLTCVWNEYIQTNILVQILMCPFHLNRTLVDLKTVMFLRKYQVHSVSSAYTGNGANKRKP